MKIEYLGFVPAILLLLFVVKEAVEEWRYSFMKLLLFYIVPSVIIVYSIIFGLLTAVNAL